MVLQRVPEAVAHQVKAIPAGHLVEPAREPVAAVVAPVRRAVMALARLEGPAATARPYRLPDRPLHMVAAAEELRRPGALEDLAAVALDPLAVDRRPMAQQILAAVVAVTTRPAQTDPVVPASSFF